MSFEAEELISSIKLAFPTLSEFVKMESNDIYISVPKINDSILSTTYDVSVYFIKKEILYSVSKRYTEFAGLYDSITMRYKNFSFPEFPSKMQLFNKVDSRKKYFDSFLRTILQLGMKHVEIKNEIMRILYDFIQTTNEKDKSLKVCRKSSLEQDLNGSFFEIEEKKIEANLLDKVTKKSPTKEGEKSTYGSFAVEKPQDEVIKDGWDIFFSKKEGEFRKGFMKIENQVLFIHDSVVSNNFSILIPLFKLRYSVDKIYRFDPEKKRHNLQDQAVFKIINENSLNKLSDLVFELLINIFHDYDNSTFTIKFDLNYNISVISSILQTFSKIENMKFEPNKYIGEINENNLNIYGKISLILSDVFIYGLEGCVYAKISINPYTFNTKAVISKTKFVFNQHFFIPIHNKFEIILIEFFMSSSNSWYQSKQSSDKFAEYKIVLPHFLNQLDPYSISYESNIELSRDYDIVTSKEFENCEKKLIFKFGVQNHTTIGALLQRNCNKNVLEEMVFMKSDDLGIKIILRRIIRFLLLIKDFKLKYKEIFYFKHPTFSLFLIFFLNIYAFCSETNYILVHLLILLSIILFYYSPICERYFKNSIDSVLFKRKNEYYFTSEIKLKDEEEDEEAKTFDYLSDKKKKKNFIATVLSDPIKKIRDYHNTYNKVLFKFSRIISLYEKIKNLFLWTDPKISFLFLLFLIGVIIIIFNVEFRVLFFIWFWENFISHYNHYYKKHLHNLEIGRIVLKAAHSEWGQETKSKMKNVTFLEVSDIDKIAIFDDKYRSFLKDFIERNLNVVVPDTLLKSVKTLGEIRERMGKCFHLLKFKKDNILYNQIKSSKYFYKKNVAFDDLLYDFIFNIKSDYYIAKYDLKY